VRRPHKYHRSRKTLSTGCNIQLKFFSEGVGASCDTTWVDVQQLLSLFRNVGFAMYAHISGIFIGAVPVCSHVHSVH